MAKTYLPLLIIVGLAFLAGWNLLKPGLIPTHDGEYHVVRFYEFDKMLHSGVLYPRWQPDLNNGYGSPLSNYYYPLPNYFGSLLHTLGLSFIDAFKMQLFFCLILAGIGMYLWARKFWGNVGGFVSAVVYVYSPYFFVDTYVRGSVGETWCLVFFPFFLWAITQVAKEKEVKYSLYASFFLALIIFSHNILAYMFMPLAFFYALLLLWKTKNKNNTAQKFFLIALFGFGLSSVFWLPALLEQGYVRGLKIYNIEENFPELYQLIFPSWGTGFSQGSLENQMSFQIGVINLLGVFVSVILLILQRFKNEKKEVILFFVASFFIVFFLMIRQSSFLWKNVPLLNYFQFPWRYLSIEILISAILLGSIFRADFFHRLRGKIIVFAFLTTTILLTIGYTKPAYYLHRDDNYYLSRPNFIDGTNTPGNIFNTIWLNTSLDRKQNKLEETKIIQIENQYIKPVSYLFKVNLKNQTDLTINTAYFPGWYALIDGKKTNVTHNKDGLITFLAPRGEHEILVKLGDTTTRQIATFVSLVSIIVLLYLYIKCLKISVSRFEQ